MIGTSRRLAVRERQARFGAEEASGQVFPPRRLAVSFPTPANETDRLSALRTLDIMDSARETAYDEIVELAAQICGCPVAYISFIDDDRRWLKARYGLPAGIAA